MIYTLLNKLIVYYVTCFETYSSLTFSSDFFVKIFSINACTGFNVGIKARNAKKNNDKNDLKFKISFIDFIS